jgi:hypothetical protein
MHSILTLSDSLCDNQKRKQNIRGMTKYVYFLNTCSLSPFLFNPFLLCNIILFFVLSSFYEIFASELNTDFLHQLKPNGRIRYRRGTDSELIQMN